MIEEDIIDRIQDLPEIESPVYGESLVYSNEGCALVYNDEMQWVSIPTAPDVQALHDEVEQLKQQVAELMAVTKKQVVPNSDSFVDMAPESVERRIDDALAEILAGRQEEREREQEDALCDAMEFLDEEEKRKEAKPADDAWDRAMKGL